MSRRTVILPVLAAMAAGAAPAAAAAPPTTKPVVRLVACDTTARTAEFQGDMPSLPESARMQMRFSVDMRERAGRWRRVQAPRLDTWVSSLPGKQRYVYAKHLENLQPGVAYRVRVRFRWRAPDGTTLQSVERRSRTCRVPDDRPDLVPLDLTAAPGFWPDSRVYAVTVANHGRSTAPPSYVALAVGPVALADRPLPALAPRERATVTFEGPACIAGDLLMATVDGTGVVDEAREADNIFTVACPDR